MKFYTFLGKLQETLNYGIKRIKDYEIKIDLDHSLDPEEINIEIDDENKIITIIKGNCGF
jgi:hypothetical protein